MFYYYYYHYLIFFLKYFFGKLMGGGFVGWQLAWVLASGLRPNKWHVDNDLYAFNLIWVMHLCLSLPFKIKNIPIIIIFLELPYTFIFAISYLFPTAIKKPRGKNQCQQYFFIPKQCTINIFWNTFLLFYMM